MKQKRFMRLVLYLVFLAVPGLVLAQTHPDDIYWDAAFGANAANQRVTVLYVDGNDLYAGGNFTQIGGIEARRIAKWDGANWHAFGDGLGGADPWDSPHVTIEDVVVHDGVLYVGGGISESGGIQYNHVARWTGTQWAKMTTGVEVAHWSHPVQGLEQFQGDIYVCGSFYHAGGKTVNHIARWDGAGWHDLDGGLTSWDFAGAFDMATDDQYLYVAGYFTHAGGVPAMDLARWDGSEWTALNAASRGGWRSIAVVDGNLYGGGWFSTSGADGTVNNIGMWDGAQWHTLDGGTNDGVLSIFPVGNDVYVAGNFTRAGGKAINRVAVWDGDDWRPVGSGVDLQTWTFAVAARENGEVFVGGDHDTAGGISSPHISRWFNPVPYAASPVPPNGSTNQRADVRLEWGTSGATGVPDSYDLYLGTTPDPPLVAAGLTSSDFLPDTLYNDTKYYWRVVSWNGSGDHATGRIWTFRTEDLVTSKLIVSSASGRCDTAPDTVAIDINIEDCDVPVDAAGLDLQYDPSVLTYLYCEPGDLTAGWQYFDCADLGTSVRAGGFDTTPIPASSYGTFARLYFLADCCGVDSTTIYDLTPVNLTDDLAGLRGEPGVYTCEYFEPDGDINADGYITSSDAYCTFNTYLSYPVPLPNDCGSSGWDIRADVDCSGDITPGDALCIYYSWLDGSCDFCEGVGPAAAASRSPASVTIREIRYDETTVEVVIAVSNVPSLDAFGFEIGYTDGPLEFVGVARSSSIFDFEQFDAIISGTDRVRVGGFHISPVDATVETDLVVVHFNLLDASVAGSIEIIGYVDDLTGAAPVYDDVTGVGGAKPRYDRYVLHQNYPNPFNPDTEIRYEVPGYAGLIRVEITIYDVKGRLVKNLENRERNAGSYAVRWNGINETGKTVSSGVYFYVLRTGQTTLSRKLVLLR